MNKSLIWIAAGVAGIGFAIPTYAAVSSHTTGPVTTPSPTVVSVASVPRLASSDDTVTTTASIPSIVSLPSNTVDDSPEVTTATSVDDHGTCTGEDANDDRCTGIDGSDAAANSTTNSVEDVSGPCDEAEHADDPRCTNAATTSASDDNSASNSGRGNGSDDSNHGSNQGGDGGHGSSNDG